MKFSAIKREYNDYRLVDILSFIIVLIELNSLQVQWNLNYIENGYKHL